MTIYTFTHANRNLVIGRSSLYLIGDDLATRDLVLSRVSSQGRVSVKSYKLISRDLILASVPSIGRFSNRILTHTSRNLVLERSTLGGTVLSTKLFPDIVPTALQFKPPRYVVTEHLAQSGEVEKHLWADSKAGASLQLDYTNTPDATAERIMALWDSTYGASGNLSIPDTVLAGVGQQLTAYMLTGGSGAKWFFAEAPKWQGTVKGYGDMKVSLISKLVQVTGIVGGNTPFPTVSTIAEATSSCEDCDYIGKDPDMGYVPDAWTVQYSGSNSGSGGRVRISQFGSIYHAILTSNGGTTGISITKLYSNGQLAWNIFVPHTPGTDTELCLDYDDSTQALYVGFSGGNRIAILKVTGDGSLVWSTQLSGIADVSIYLLTDIKYDAFNNKLVIQIFGLRFCILDPINGSVTRVFKVNNAVPTFYYRSSCISYSANVFMVCGIGTPNLNNPSDVCRYSLITLNLANNSVTAVRRFDTSLRTVDGYPKAVKLPNSKILMITSGGRGSIIEFSADFNSITAFKQFTNGPQPSTVKVDSVGNVVFVHEGSILSKGILDFSNSSFSPAAVASKFNNDYSRIIYEAGVSYGNVTNYGAGDINFGMNRSVFCSTSRFEITSQIFTPASGYTGEIQLPSSRPTKVGWAQGQGALIDDLLSTNPPSTAVNIAVSTTDLIFSKPTWTPVVSSLPGTWTKYVSTIP
jgi:hypothetical protein